MSWTGETIIAFIIGQLVVGAAIWGGIRAEIRNIHGKVKDTAEGLRYAHERIDSIMGNGWQHNDIDRRRHER